MTVQESAGCCCTDGMLCGACATGEHYGCPDGPVREWDWDDDPDVCPHCYGRGDDFEGGTCTLCGGVGS